MAVGFIFGGDLLKLIETPDNIFADSELYLDIYIAGLPFVFFYNVSTGIFSALGDSKTPFVFLAISSVANIGADILFVAGFGMGVAGVAWATFICQGISCICAVLFVIKRLSKTKTEEKSPLFSFSILGQIAQIAIPSILQQSFISVGNIVIQSVINSFGSGVIAGYSSAVKLNNLVLTSLTTIGNGISNFTSQNIGAGKQSRISAGFKAGLKMVWLICVPLVLLYFLAGKYLVYFFLDNPSEQALETGVQFLRIVSPFYFVVAAKLAADGVLRGAGSMVKFMIATFTDLLLRVVLAHILSGIFGSVGIWLAWPVGWTAAMVLSVIFYKTGKWNKKSLSTDNQSPQQQ